MPRDESQNAATDEHQRRRFRNLVDLAVVVEAHARTGTLRGHEHEVVDPRHDRRQQIHHRGSRIETPRRGIGTRPVSIARGRCLHLQQNAVEPDARRVIGHDAHPGSGERVAARKERIEVRDDEPVRRDEVARSRRIAGLAVRHPVAVAVGVAVGVGPSRMLGDDHGGAHRIRFVGIRGRAVARDDDGQGVSGGHEAGSHESGARQDAEGESCDLLHVTNISYHSLKVVDPVHKKTARSLKLPA